MEYLLLAVSVFLGLLKNIVSKKSKFAFDNTDNLLYSNIVTAALAVMVFAWFGIDFTMLKNPILIIMAFIFGILAMLSQMLYIIAVKKGSVTVCSLVYSCGFLIPTVFGILYYNEKVSACTNFGVLLLIFGILAVTGKTEKPNTGQSLVWAILAMICSGGVGVLQKIFRTEYPHGSPHTFLCVAFAFMLIISVISITFRSNGNHTVTISGNNYMISSWILLAISVVFANQLNLYLSGVLKGAVFFPCVNGGCIAATAIVSYLLLKERLSVLQWSGVICTVISIVLIALKN